MDTRPIGVFDSGLGGLTAVRELTKILPQEDIIYFGDTGRVPYGTRSSDTIRRYVQQDIRFLLSKNVKMIIAACGTASANITQEMVEQMGVPYTGVVVPAALKAAEVSKTHQIGLIGTSATVRSKAFENVLKTVSSVSDDCNVTAVACPLFVSLVENGYSDFENPVTRLVAADYLKPFLQNPQLDTLILGCTHFPVLADIIGDLLGQRIRLVDAGREVAHYTRRLLQQKNLCGDPAHTGVCQYYVSDNVECFAENAQVILREPVSGQVEKIDIDTY